MSVRVSVSKKTFGTRRQANRVARRALSGADAVAVRRVPGGYKVQKFNVR